MTEYGKLLKRAREELGLTQEELARHSGVSLGAVRNYEQGGRMPGFVQAVRLADVLGVPVEEFARAVREPAASKKGKKS